MKEFVKSVNIWRRYGHMCVGAFCYGSRRVVQNTVEVDEECGPVTKRSDD